MTGVVKGILAGVVVLAAAVAGEVAYIHHRNVEDATLPAAPKSTYKADPDDLVFVKHEHPNTFKDAKDLKGRTLWVSAGGQMDFYPYNGHTVDFAHTQGVLLGADKLLVRDAVEQVAPKKTAFRIPQGDKQVLLVFTHDGDAREYAVPVGYKETGDYTFSTDDIFFYDDPHTLFSFWGPAVWKAIDGHRAAVGMSERQVQMALGQVSTPHGDTIGDRSVEYDDQGKPKIVVFKGAKAVSIDDIKTQ